MPERLQIYESPGITVAFDPNVCIHSGACVKGLPRRKEMPDASFKRAAAILIATLLALAGCGKPVPMEKAAYVGQWRAQAMSLLITQDGSVAYQRLKAGVTTSVNGPLKGFEGDNFLVGVGPMSTTFVVSSPPQQAGGKWKMVVDGVELTKAE